MKISNLFKKTKDETSYEDNEDEYLEINTDTIKDKEKVTIKTYALEDFSDLKPILNDLREGYTIGIINIAVLKQKDIIELKKAINKLKATCDASDGDIAGIADDWIVVTPSFAKIDRNSKNKKALKDISE